MVKANDLADSVFPAETYTARLILAFCKSIFPKLASRLPKSLDVQVNRDCYVLLHDMIRIVITPLRGARAEDGDVIWERPCAQDACDEWNLCFLFLE
jgi:hypothetical protein